MQTSQPIIVDSFAGGGGASTGIEMALGRSPDIAINHNAAALALHEANHPQTLHVSQNVYKIDPLDYLQRAHVGLAWFSPDCKHFSKAKGGKPVERNIRDLAWIIPGWIERIQKSGGKVDVAILENVEEFRDWGPLIETSAGLMPDPERKGEDFQRWCKKLKRLGAKIEWREIRGCDYGAPTIRKRFFVIMRFDGEPIVWPEPTHGAPDDKDVMAGKKQPWRTAAEIIDWSLPCPSIFDRGADIMEKHGLRAIRPLAHNTMARVARGMKRYVIDAEKPFLVNLTTPSIIRFNTGATGQDMREPLSTITANSYIKRPGGAAPLGIIAPHLASYYGHGNERSERVSKLDAPIATVVTENRHAVIAPILTAAQHGGSNRPINAPSHTITASRKDQNSVIAPALVQIGYGERKGQAPRALDIEQLLGTAVAGGIKHAVASAFIARQFGTSTGHSIEEPTHTVMADGAGKSQLIAAYVAQHNNDSRRAGGVNPGRSASEPLSTVTQTGSQQGIVAPFLQAYYGTGDGGTENEPMRTVTTKDRHGHVEASLEVPPFTPEQADRARTVAEFLRSFGFWDDREFVTIESDGVTYVIVDIGMRMLVPRELYLAQGFPADYEIERGADGQTFSKSVQVSCCGNSVCPPVAAALVSANCEYLFARKEAA
ncbi:DNA cytosine methyltransferase [Brucella sp. C7-11G]